LQSFSPCDNKFSRPCFAALMRTKVKCLYPVPNLSQLRDAQLTDHGAAVRQVEDGKGMPMERGDGNDSEGQAVTNVSRRETNNHHQNEQQARGDRSSLKVLHLPHFIGERSGRDVEASQAADATPDEEHKNERI